MWSGRFSLRPRVAVAAGLLLGSVVLVGNDGGAATAAAAHVTNRYQFGINTYATYACQHRATYRAWATTQFTQFKALRANAVAIAFPLYTDYPTSNRVYAETDCTTFKHQSPTPQILGDLIDVAHRLKLKVLVRPLVDQTSFIPYGRFVWRGVLAPTDVPLWFTNYLNTLRPYLQVAQAHHAEHFAIESELTSLAHLPGWSAVIALSKNLYKGDLAWNMSWHSDVPKIEQSGTSFAIDAYPSVVAPSTASVPTLVSKWTRLLQTQPNHYAVPNISHTTIDEIGISAQDGMYALPSAYGYSLSKYPFDQTVQVRWFTAACSFMKQHHMRGIYFWGQWLARRGGRRLSSPSPTYADEIQPAAAAAIRRCF